MADRPTFPKIPESNWWALRAQFVKTLPASVTPTYIMSVLSLDSIESAKNLIRPLKQFGLVDDDGKVTSRANDWRNDAKYDETCRLMVDEVYPQELRDLFPGPDVDRASCQNWLMHSAKLGESTARQCASLFILLRTQLQTVMIAEERNKAEQKSPKKPSQSNPAKQPNGLSEVPTAAKPRPEATDGTTQAVGRPILQVTLQLQISKEASAEQIDNLFASMAKHLFRE